MVAEGLVLGDALDETSRNAVNAWLNDGDGRRCRRNQVTFPARPEDGYLSSQSADDFTRKNGTLSKAVLSGNSFVPRKAKEDAKKKTGKPWLTPKEADAARKTAKGATIIAFDAAFALSRFSPHAGGARSNAGHGVYRNGLSIAVFGSDPKGSNDDREFTDSPGHPRLLAVHLNPGVTMTSWAPDNLLAGDNKRAGDIIDLKQLGRALCGLSDDVDFDLLCDQYGIAHVPAADPDSGIAGELEWLEARMNAQVDLYKALILDVETWHEAGAKKIRSEYIYSVAGLGRGVIESAGFQPPENVAKKLDRDVRGAFAGAMYGGRTEALLLRHPTPVLMADFSSNYVTTASLLGISSLFTASKITAKDVTEDLKEWLDHLAKADNPVAELLKPAVWARWGCIVAMTYPAGETLPYRELVTAGRVSGGVAPVTGPVATALPYCWPDLAAAVIARPGGRAPEIERAWQLVAAPRTATDLEKDEPVQIPGADLKITTADDLFVQLLSARMKLQDKVKEVEKEIKELRAKGDDYLAGLKAGRMLTLRRYESALKGIGNTCGFGNLSRFDRTEAKPDGDAVDIVDPWGGTFACQPKFVETTSRWTFPPAAASVTAGARLLVAMAKRRVEDEGGTVAAILTDSLMIPALPALPGGGLPDGGLWPTPGGSETIDGKPAIKLLEWNTVERILAEFDSLRLDGAKAWKFEHHTHDNPKRPLHGSVFGLNAYVIFDPKTHDVIHGAESHLGGTILDPTGSGDERLDDGRRAWVKTAHQALIESDNHRALVKADEKCKSLGEILKELGKELGIEWGDSPAVSAWRATSMEQLKWLQHELPHVQPFTSFLLAREFKDNLAVRAPSSTTDDGLERPLGSPIAPFDPDPKRWLGLPWRYRNGERVERFAVRSNEMLLGYGSRGKVGFTSARVEDAIEGWMRMQPRGMREIGGTWYAHGIHRSLGVLANDTVVLIGKEASRLLESALGVTVDPDEELTTLTASGDYVGGVRRDLVKRLGLHYLARNDGASDSLSLNTLSQSTKAFFKGDSKRSPYRAVTREVLDALDRFVANDLKVAKLDPEVLRGASQSTRYGLALGLLEGTRGVTKDGLVVELCRLPGCEKKPKRSGPGGFCSWEHFFKATGSAVTEAHGRERPVSLQSMVPCEFPECDELVAPGRGARFCGEEHRQAMAMRQHRARAAAKCKRPGCSEDVAKGRGAQYCSERCRDAAAHSRTRARDKDKAPR